MEVVESRLASSVLASIYLTMMRADESLQHLMGSLCQDGLNRMLPECKSESFGFLTVRRASGLRRQENYWMAGASLFFFVHLVDWPPQWMVRFRFIGCDCARSL